MANQIIIDIGAVANDGTGDPLRTAFGYVNNNFSNVWATGVANSNIQFDGNRILTTNTNGNLVLAPNGIGKVQANVDIVPNANNTLSLGSLTRQWNTVYARNLEVAGDTTFNNLTVNGNLTVDGDIIQIGNLVTDAKTIQLANTASTTTAANGSGITVGANDNIATLLYNSTSNTWTMNIGANVTGNVTAPYFIGNGALLTGITSYGNANVAAYLPTYTGNLSAGNLSVSSSGDTWTIEGQTITAPGGAIWYSNPDQSTDDFISAPGSNIRIQALNNSNVVEGQFSLTSAAASLFVNNGISRTWNFNESGNTEFPGCLIPLGAGGVCGNIGNITNPWSNAYISGNVNTGNISLTGTVASNLIPVGNNVQSLGNSTNYWANLWVANNTIYIGGVALGMTAGNVLTVNGNAVLQNNSNTTISTTGNITGGYIFGNGSQLTGLSTSSISSGNSNVAIATANGNVTITSAGTETWTFGSNGTTTLPNYTLLNPVDEDLYVVVQDADDDGFAIFNRITDEDGNVVGQTELQRDRFNINLDMLGSNYQWEFSDFNGTMTLPGNIQGTYGASTSFYAVDDGNNGLVEMKTISYIGDTLGSNIRVTQSNATISTGNAAHTWTFDNTGNLTLPRGGVVYETSIPGGALTGNTIALKPQGGTNADQQLLIYPTALGADANHLHLTSGNLYNTELFLGNDNLYVKLANTGNIVINSNDDVGNTAQWTFGTAGTILNSGNLTLQTPNGVPGAVTAITGSSGSWESNPRNNLATAGGTGTGLTVNVTEDGGYASAIAIATAGTGYTNGDSISVVSGSSDASFTISVLSNGWTFNTAGNLTAPGNVSAVGNITGNYILGNGSQLTGLPATYGNANVATFMAAFGSNTISTSGNVTAGNLITSGNISTTWLNIGNIGNIVSLEADVDLQIVANATSNNAPYWTFNNDGTLFVPGNISGDNSAPLIVEGSGSGEGYISLPHATFGGEQVVIVNKFSLGNGIRLETNGGNLFFDNTGDLTASGNVTAQNFTGNINITGNVQGTSSNVTLVAGAYSWTFDNTGNTQGNLSLTGGSITINNAPGGNEGAEIQWALPSPANTVLSTSLVQDVFQNGMRFFEAGGNTRGLYMDLGNVPNGSTTAVGYRDIPQVSFVGNTTIATTDAGRHYYSTQSTNYTLTIANNASQGFQVGAAITVVNQGTGNITVAQGSGVTLYLAGNATSGNRTVSTFGMATIIKVATDTWFINGTGVS